MAKPELYHYIPNKVIFNFTLVFSYIFLSIGLVFLLYGNLFIGFGICLVCGTNITFRKGVYFDFDNKKYLKYQSYFMIKPGKWRDLNQYKYLTMLTAHKKSGISGRSGATITDSFVTYEIYMINEKHLNKVMIDTFKDKDEGIWKLNSLSEKLSLAKVKYESQISEASKSRRYN